MKGLGAMGSRKSGTRERFCHLRSKKGSHLRTNQEENGIPIYRLFFGGDQRTITSVVLGKANLGEG